MGAQNPEASSFISVKKSGHVDAPFKGKSPRVLEHLKFSEIKAKKKSKAKPSIFHRQTFSRCNRSFFDPIFPLPKNRFNSDTLLVSCVGEQMFILDRLFWTPVQDFVSFPGRFQQHLELYYKETVSSSCYADNDYLATYLKLAGNYIFIGCKSNTSAQSGYLCTGKIGQ